MASDALLLGRVTYEGFAAAWPSCEGMFAERFNTMPKYVVSSTLENPEWNNTTVVTGEVGEEVTKLKRRYERDIVVHGSPQCISHRQGGAVEGGEGSSRLYRFPCCGAGGAALVRSNGDADDVAPAGVAWFGGLLRRGHDVREEAVASTRSSSALFLPAVGYSRSDVSTLAADGSDGG
jgi:hypothetical protein